MEANGHAPPVCYALPEARDLINTATRRTPIIPEDTSRLAAGCLTLNLPITDQQLGLFARYSDFLSEWNKRTNLTRVPEAEFVTLHYLDSLLALAAVPVPVGATVLDIGSGAGFPGMPIAIVRPDLRVTLLDSVGKRTEFLNALVRELGLANVTVVRDRAETAARRPGLRAQCAAVYARAVAPLPVLAGWMLPFVHPKGYAIALKSRTAKAEVQAAMAAIDDARGIVHSVLERTIPGTDIERLLVVLSVGTGVVRTPSGVARLPGRRT